MTLPGSAGGDYHLYDIPDNFVAAFNQFDQYTDEHRILLGMSINNPLSIAF